MPLPTENRSLLNSSEGRDDLASSSHILENISVFLQWRYSKKQCLVRTSSQER